MEKMVKKVVSSGWLGSESNSDSPGKRMIGSAMVISMFVHSLLLAAILVVKSMPQAVTIPVQKEEIKTNIVFLNDPGSGGGGGGSPMPAPPKPTEIPKHKRIELVPIVALPISEAPPPVPVLNVSIEANSASILQMNGVSPISLGTYAGGGSGGGIGSGKGDGVGPGTGGGFGDGAYAPGNGVTEPVLIYQVQPSYNPDAMRARIQGVVLLEAIVMPDGRVGKVRVIKSLDTKYGLDEEAVKAAKKWLFQPGMRQGQKVPVVIQIEMSFRLH
ncbi:MAG: TonB family protein [Candidatus Yanofskybacteria bacterium GW2011_GWA2_44_9]|uniref:TonB family protein n=2 Tax=Candidatus Yanofskyibacteriota TaxID=1752733 RepID=A0A0G1MKA3_9BACT|nr:MAG: TonB family protein [Candidatus Yanofskybacteria bacterium GW2011_GWA2_44_9]